MPLIDDPRYTGVAVTGPVNSGLFARPEPEHTTPPVLDTLAAAARQSTLAGAAYERLVNHDPDLPEAPAGWDPLDHIEGFEDHAGAFVDAQTPSEVQGIKNRIQAQRADQQVLARAGWGGTAVQFAATAIDPSFLAAAAVPELTIARGARMAAGVRAVSQGAVAAGTYETGMHQLQADRTASETLFNVGGAALLSGVLGHLLHSVPAKESSAIREAINAEIGSLQSTAGAAAASRTGTLAEESIARGGKGLSKALGKTPLIGTDLDVVMASDSPAARGVLQELADVTPILEKNRQGIATPTSVESFVGKHEARVADFMDTARGLWAEYRGRVPRETQVSRGDFYTEIASAARSGDQSAIPEVQKAAQFLRSRVFDPLKADADSLGLFAGKDGAAPPKVLGAESYFRRMYDREAIRANLSEWERIINNHFAKDGADKAEIKAAVDDVTKKILGADVGESNFATKVTVGAAGPLKERTLDVPDRLIEKFLVNDPERIARAYVRDMAPQVELAKRFGDVEMKQQLSSISDEYGVLKERARERITDAEKLNQELKRLTDQETKTLEAIVRVRDRILGRAGRLSPDAGEGTRAAVMASRGWRNWVAASKLGATALTGGLMDTARIAAQYGFLPTVRKIAQLIASPEYRALSRAQARRVGSAVEVALSRRVMVANDGAITEGWTQKLANGVYKWTGLNHGTDFNRTLSATLLEDEVLKNANRVAEGKAVPAYVRSRLASLGLGDDELKQVAQQVAKYGGESGGIRVSGSADWKDKPLADVYDAAILKESKIAVQQPGAADRVWWMDKEMGKFIGQLKTFSLSSPSRLLTPALQMAGHGEYARAARFIGFMMIGGALTHAVRQTIAGKKPNTNPVGLAGEALTESGIAGVFPDLLSPLGRRLGLFGESVRYADRNVTSALGGPAIGALADTYDFAMNRTQGGMSASDLHMLRRMIPWNNVWWLRREINALEGESAEALDLKGADSSTFTERLLRTDAVAPASQRGGTGTGQVAQ